MSELKDDSIGGDPGALGDCECGFGECDCGLGNDAVLTTWNIFVK